MLPLINSVSVNDLKATGLYTKLEKIHTTHHAAANGHTSKFVIYIYMQGCLAYTCEKAMP